MTNNDILRRLRYALNLNDASAVALFALAQESVSTQEVRAWVGREDDADAVLCSDAMLGAFLDGLIIAHRGPPKDAPPSDSRPEMLSNNAILKKIRIALSFRNEDVLALLAEGGMMVSKSELGALFRKPEHRHYRECGDQLLRKFLAGLSRRMRAKEQR